MKNILIVVGVLIVLGVLGYFGYTYVQEKQSNDTNVEQTEAPDNTEKGTNTNGKVIVTVPEGWEKILSDEVDHQYMKKSAGFVLKTEDFGTTNLDEVFTKALEVLDISFDNAKKIESTKNIKLDGHDAKEIVFTASNMKYMYVYTVVNDQVYTIIFGDSADTFDNYKTDYQTILDGIKF